MAWNLERSACAWLGTQRVAWGHIGVPALPCGRWALILECTPTGLLPVTTIARESRMPNRQTPERAEEWHIVTRTAPATARSDNNALTTAADPAWRL
jgi:hypothetical protein